LQTAAFDKSQKFSPSAPAPDVLNKVDEMQELSNAMNVISGVQDKETAPEICKDVEQGELFGVGVSS
jgi:hypothetical protein